MRKIANATGTARSICGALYREIDIERLVLRRRPLSRGSLFSSRGVLRMQQRQTAGFAESRLQLRQRARKEFGSEALARRSCSR